MSPLVEYQFELDGIRFGGDRGALLVVEEFDPGADDFSVTDQRIPHSDTLAMGRDFVSPGRWVFKIATIADDAASAFDLMEQLKAAWSNRGLRRKPGAVVPLRWAHGGRHGVAYGRPRHWSRSYAPKGALAQGVIRVDCEFHLVDPLTYGDVDSERSTTLSLFTRPDGGWVWPATFPIETAASSESFAGNITVDSVVPVAPVIEIAGPVANPWVEGPGWRFQLSTTLAYDQSVTIDARPWAATVLRSDGASLGGALGSTRLADVRLPVGGSQVRFGGIDPTNTATCIVRWRPAYEGL